MRDTEFTSTEFNGNGWKVDLSEMLLAKDKLEKMLEPKTSMFGIPIYENPLVPKGEIWCINNKKEIFKIIHIGNTMNSSKLYRFILWWQNLVGKIKTYFHKLAELQQEAIKFQNDMEKELWKDKK